MKCITTWKNHLVGLIDYVRILKALISLLLFVINHVPNHNGKVLEEALGGSNSDALKIALRGLRYFKMTLPKVLQQSLPIPLVLCLI